MTTQLYKAIALALIAVANCEREINANGPTADTAANAARSERLASARAWRTKHRDWIARLVREHMPSGAGIDTGTKLDDSSTPDRLVFSFSFHHMNEHGSYDGWTEHTAIVKPSLAFGFDLKITGRDRNQIKDYLHETYHQALGAEV